ncbi:hypothetical protein CGRA01v4_10809 [Colletotrichum graminicola]|nr:hypothetical protein CGRA01v4_10809 [Colletotrichum graminicola]
MPSAAHLQLRPFSNIHPSFLCSNTSCSDKQQNKTQVDFFRRHRPTQYLKRAQL